MPISNAALALAVSDLIAHWQSVQGEFQAWMNGTVGGGPNSNGKYPLTDYLGVTTLTTSPAKLVADSSAIPGAATSAAAAASSATAAAASATTATTQASAASTSASTASSAATAASSSASAAASSAATAVAQASAASASATAAAASAVLAATFNPALYAVLTTANVFVGSAGGFKQTFKNTSATGYAGAVFMNDQASVYRALEIDYSGSAYSGSLVTGGPTGESACIVTTGAYPLALGTNNAARLVLDGTTITALATIVALHPVLLKDPAGTASAMLQWTSYQDSAGNERGWVGYGETNTTFRVHNSIGPLYLDGSTVFLGGVASTDFARLSVGNDFTAGIATMASTAPACGFRLPHGVAPTAPANGDMWTTTAGLYVRINGTTIGPIS